MKRISRPRPRHAILQQSDGALWSFTTEETCPDPTLYLLEDVEGWYGGSGVRRKTTDRYGHGTFMGPGFRDGRAMTLKAAIVCDGPDERDWQERNVSGMLWDGLVGELWVDDGETMLGSPVALDGAPQVVKSGTRALRIQVPLISEEPFVYSEWREVTLDPPGIGVGFEFPPFSKEPGDEPVITFGAEVNRQEYVWNEGNADSYPQFTVFADSPGGFALGLADRLVTYPWATFPDVPVVVDMAGALFVGGRDQTHLVGERNWSHIPATALDVPVFKFLQGGTGFCTVAHRDTYI